MTSLIISLTGNLSPSNPLKDYPNLIHRSLTEHPYQGVTCNLYSFNTNPEVNWKEGEDNTTFIVHMYPKKGREVE